MSPLAAQVPMEAASPHPREQTKRPGNPSSICVDLRRRRPVPLLLKTKLFALCDRGTDLSDCVALAPTTAELADAMIWLAEQDTNPGWPAHVKATIADVTQRLLHGV